MQIDSLASNHYGVSLASQTVSHSAAPIRSNLLCVIESDQCCGTESVWYARLVHSYGWYYRICVYSSSKGAKNSQKGYAQQCSTKKNEPWTFLAPWSMCSFSLSDINCWLLFLFTECLQSVFLLLLYIFTSLFMRSLSY